jgi:hypothetical protein
MAYKVRSIDIYMKKYQAKLWTLVTSLSSQKMSYLLLYKLFLITTTFKHFRTVILVTELQKTSQI